MTVKNKSTMIKIVSILLLLQVLACVSWDNDDYFIPISKSSAYVKHFMDSTKVPGMSIAVLHKGKLIWSKGFGYSDIELKVPVINKSKFRIASVSKPITAVLTARLNQNNILDIDIPAHNILNDFPKKRWGFNIRQLMSHAAGIRHYSKKDTNYIDFHNSIERGLEIIKHDSLLHKPGSKYSYSSYGYNIIGAFIEKSTGKLLGDILTDSLFVPLEMGNSTIDDPFVLIPDRTSAYILNENGDVMNAPFYDNRYKIPAGGILSMAEDLVQFGHKILHSNYLNKESVSLLFTPYKYTDEKSSDLGFGWIVTTDEHGNKLYGHLGGNTGGCSAIMIYPEKELIVAWLGNLDADWSDIPTKTIANYFLETLN